jgi:hypothetical protein
MEQRAHAQRGRTAVHVGSTRLSSSSAHWPHGIWVAHPPVKILNRPHARMSHGRKPSNTALVKSTNLSNSAFHPGALLDPESHAWIFGLLLDRNTYGNSAKIYCKGVPLRHASSTCRKSLGFTGKGLLLVNKTLRRPWCVCSGNVPSARKRSLASSVRDPFLTPCFCCRKAAIRRQLCGENPVAFAAWPNGVRRSGLATTASAPSVSSNKSLTMSLSLLRIYPTNIILVL